jgi:superfamily I DNA/RNA helicase
MSPENHAFISRTNASMIGRMIELDERHIQYNLVRPVKSIFELILILVYLKPGGDVFNVKYKFLQTEADEWESHPEHKLIHPTLFSYIAEVNEGDVEIASAMSLISRFGKDTVMATYSNAQKHENDRKTHRITLTTAHSSKGLEYDSVHIDDDMNQALQKLLNDEYVIENGLTDKHKEEFRLYYVACTRAKFQLHNAEFVDHEDSGFDI